MRRYFAVVLAAAMSANAASTSAQVRPDSAARATRLDTLVVTAARLPQAAPASAVTVLHGEDLRRDGIAHLADALRPVPGIMLVQTGSAGGLTSLYMRGGERGYTRVLLDGVPLNEPGGDFDFSQLSTHDVERVEIVRGPGSVLYGSDAVSGVIQIFTRTGRVAGWSGSARGGSFGTTALEASAEGGDGARRGAISASRFRTAGIYAFNNGHDRIAVTASAAGSIGRDTESRLVVRYGNEGTHIPTDGTGAVVDRNALQSAQRTLLAASLRRQFGERTEARLQLSAVHNTSTYDDRADDAADTLGFFAYRSLDNVDRNSIEVNAARDLRRLGRLLLGAAVERQSQRSLNQWDSEYAGGAGELVASRMTRSAYAQSLHDGRFLSALVGARVDANDRFGTFLTYRAGMGATRGSTRLRASLGTGFREPTFVESFATGFARGNQALLPEHAVNTEVGADQVVKAAGLRVSVTAFDQRFRDLIEYTFQTAAPEDPNFYNVAGATVRGIEGELHLALAPWFTLHATGTALRTRVTRQGFDSSVTGYYRVGEPLLRRTRTLLSLGLQYDRSGNAAGIRAHHVGPRNDIDYATYTRITLRPHTTLDASARASLRRLGPALSALALSARVTNVLDERYQAVSGFASPGRAMLVGVELGR